jgi:hypothetical protein
MIILRTAPGGTRPRALAHRPPGRAQPQAVHPPSTASDVPVVAAAHGLALPGRVLAGWLR